MSRPFISQFEIGVVGIGRFGRALLGGLLKSGKFPPSRLWAVDHFENALSAARSQLQTLRPSDSAETVRLGLDAKDFLNPSTRLLLLAVKPHQISEVIGSLKTLISETYSPVEMENLLIISVAAGTSLQKLESEFDLPLKMIRAMSNSPALIQEGMTSLAKGSRATDEDLGIALEIFSTLGKVNVLEEKLFDAITAVSGSGPAYFYFLMEAMIEAAKSEGIPEAAAQELVLQTAKGAGLLAATSTRSPSELRGDVATPGGCTVAALEVMEGHEFRQLVQTAIRRATSVAATLGR